MPIPLEESLEPCWVFPSKISGIREGSIPLPLSDMVKTAPLFFLDTFTPIGAVLPEWRMAFSIRLMSTCSIRVASMGTISISSGTETFTTESGKRLRIRPTASPTISSMISSCFFRLVVPPVIFVTESRFSTM